MYEPNRKLVVRLVQGGGRCVLHECYERMRLVNARTMQPTACVHLDEQKEEAK